MNQNPDLKFSVEGHTDSTGNAANNQMSSKASSAAIVAKLTELGIAADRLSAAGKGQNKTYATITCPKRIECPMWDYPAIREGVIKRYVN